jgi:hypothetical protein
MFNKQTAILCRQWWSVARRSERILEKVGGWEAIDLEISRRSRRTIPARFQFCMHSSGDGLQHPHDPRPDRPPVMPGPNHNVDVHFKGIEQSHQFFD